MLELQLKLKFQRRENRLIAGSAFRVGNVILHLLCCPYGTVPAIKVQLMQKNPFSADDPRNAWYDPLLKLAIHAGDARLRTGQYRSQYDQREPESTFEEAVGTYNRVTDGNKAQFGNLPEWPIANAKIFNIILKTTRGLIETTIRCDEIESEINVPADARLPKFAYFAEIMRAFWNVLKVLPGSKKPHRPDADYITASQALCHIDKLQKWCQIQMKKSEKKPDKKRRGKRDSDSAILFGAIESWHNFGSENERSGPASIDELLNHSLRKIGWEKSRTSKAFKSLCNGKKKYNQACTSGVTEGFINQLRDGEVRIDAAQFKPHHPTGAEMRRSINS